MRTISIRESLARNIVAIVLLMSATLLVASYFGARRAVEDLSSRLIEQSASQAEAELENFFGSIESVVLASSAWWDADLIEYRGEDDITGLNALFIPVMDAYPQVTSMMLVHDAGFEYLLFRDLRGGEDYEWYNRVIMADAGPDAGFEMLWTDNGELFRRGPLPESARDYDPRKRPFYTTPPENEIFWTEPYYFFITKDAGMTACYKWRNPQTGRMQLVAFDLLLMDLSQFTAGLQPSEHGKAFVMLDDGSLLGVPRDERWANPVAVRETLRNPDEREGGVTVVDRSAKLLTARDLELPAVADAADFWRGARKSETNLFRYISDGEAWWGGFHPFPLGDRMLWIGVVVPEDDFLTEIRRQRNAILTIAVVALCGAIIMAGIMARRFSRPLETLAEQSARVRELELSSNGPVESNITEVKQLADANEQMMRALDSFARYVPMDVVRELLRRGEVARIGGNTETLSILFTDIEAFTAMAEQTEPEQLTAQMAEYFSAMLVVLADEKATVDKFIGDAIVAFWGAPRPIPDHAQHAVRAVLRGIEALEAINDAWAERGIPGMRTRFGLNCGDAVVGNVGSPERMNYTVLGDAVNLASRLESLNAEYGTQAIGSESMVRAAGEAFVWRRLDRVAVKGKTEAVDIYELLGEAGTIPEDSLKASAEYEAALQLYLDGNFGQAAELLEAAARRRPEDAAVTRLLEIVRQYAESPPAGWDGVTRFV